MGLTNGNSAHMNCKEDHKQNGHEEPNHPEEGSDQEVIVIQDTGFTVKIHAPGIELFPLQVSVSGSPSGL